MRQFRTLTLRLMLIAGILLPTGTAFAQESVKLHLSPRGTAPVLREVSASDAVIVRGVELETRKGWFSGEYEDTYTGFVDPKSIRDDFTIAPDTLIYLEPEPTSDVLATSDPAAKVEILGVSPFWAEIKVTQKVPVFFQKGSPGLVAAPALPPAPTE